MEVSDAQYRGPASPQYQNPTDFSSYSIETGPVQPPTPITGGAASSTIDPIMGANTTVTGGIAGGANTTGLDPSQSTLSPNFSQYVYNMLGKAEGLASLPYQEYTGQRYAGPSELQQQAFKGIAGLGVPSQFDTATKFATQAGTALSNLTPYTPSAGPQYSSAGAGSVRSDYVAPAAYQAAQFKNEFNAPGAYQSADLTGGLGGQQYKSNVFDTQLGPLKSVQDYMSQYTTGVSDVAAREATRQADISRQAEQARLAQAGGYGGARQAIMEAERQRNLGTQISDIRTQGLQAAFDRAQQQRLAEAGMGMEAQKATEGSRQFGATYGQQGLGQLLQAKQASEQSRQFGAQQGMTAADLQAKYGLSAQQAAEASRQFGAQQGMTAAEQAARFSLSAQQSNQSAALQSSIANQQASLEAARQAEASRQFGANYGLQGLQSQLQAAQALGGLGMQQQSAQRDVYDTQLRAGETQRKMAQDDLDFGYKQFEESMKYPYQQLTFMQSMLQGLPLQGRSYQPEGSGTSAAISGGLSGLALYKLLTGEEP